MPILVTRSLFKLLFLTILLWSALFVPVALAATQQEQSDPVVKKNVKSAIISTGEEGVAVEAESCPCAEGDTACRERAC